MVSRTRVLRIGTHQRPHLDEVLGYWMLQKFGGKQFPGVETAGLVFGQFDGKSAAQWEAEGALLLGVGGGRFDEHNRPGKERDEAHSSASLVFRELRLYENRALDQIVDYVSRVDTKGGAGPLDLGRLAQKMFVLERDPKDVIDFMITGIEVEYASLTHYYLECARLFAAAAKRSFIGLPNGSTGKLAVVEIADPQIASYARKEGDMSVVVLRNPQTGWIQIFRNPRQGVCLDTVVKHLRIQERAAKGLEQPLPVAVLTEEGTVAGAEEWYYDKPSGNIFNGTPSYPDTPLTSLELKDVVGIIYHAMNPATMNKPYRPSKQ